MYMCYWCSMCGKYQTGEIKDGKFTCSVCGNTSGHY